MRVFITGGTGYVGAHIVVQLVAEGHPVTILARDPDKIPAFRKMRGVSFVQGSLEDIELIRDALPGHDACIHNALIWGDEAAERKMADVRASANLFSAVEEAGIRHLVYTSSVAVHRPFQPEMDEASELHPADLYGQTKAAGEKLLQKSNLRHTIIRPGPVVGEPAVSGAPFKSDRHFIEFVKTAQGGGEIRVGRGEGRQFTSAEALARFHASVLARQGVSETYIAVASELTTWEAVARMVVAEVGLGEVIVEDSSEPPHLFLPNKAARMGHGFDASNAIRDHIRWIISSGNTQP